MGKHKYGAVKTDCGHCPKPHPSKAEAKRCGELHILQRDGRIKHLETQPTYYFQLNGSQIKHENGRRLAYRPDWRYWEGDLHIAEECKGFPTEAYVLKLAFFKAFFPYVTHRTTGKAA